MKDLIWMSIMILLLGSYYLFGTLDPISNQAHFINEIKETIDEVKRSTDQYVDSLKEYCELKALVGWFSSSLSEQQKDRMHQLREYLGFDVNLGVNVATSIVRNVSEKVMKTLSLQLSEQIKVLNDISLLEMKKLQDKEELLMLKERMHEEIKSQITSISTELQASGGTLYQIFYRYLLAILKKLAEKMMGRILSELVDRYLNKHVTMLITYVSNNTIYS